MFKNPLKFTPIFKEKIWGGRRFASELNKTLPPNTAIGESWELSEVEGSVSIVSNGSFAGKSLSELIQMDAPALLGQEVLEQYGNSFPLLVKFLDASKDLSVQVHPNDRQAAPFGAKGKTEMWYALEGDGSSNIINGMNCDCLKEDLVSCIENQTLTQCLRYEAVKRGDVFFIPPGRIHALNAGNLVAEIQQTSDITYRLYDYNRKDAQGHTRELHIEQGLAVLDAKKLLNGKITYQKEFNQRILLMQCDFFTTHIWFFNQTTTLSYPKNDRFKIFICTDGQCTIKTQNTQTQLQRGETILIPASIEKMEIIPQTIVCKCLETSV